MLGLIVAMAIVIGGALGAGHKDGLIGKGAIHREVVAHQTEMYEFEQHAAQLSKEAQEAKLAKIEKKLKALNAQ